MRAFLFLCVALLAVPAMGAPLRVVATFSILGDIARQVGGERIALTTLVGADGDAHVYEPRPADLIAVAQADLVIANGLGFEPWLPRLVSAAGGHAIAVTASRGIAPRRSHGEIDPHAWQDAADGARYAANIGEALAAADPPHAAQFRASAAAYAGQLRALDADIRRRFAALSPSARRIVTNHDAFGYFAEAYGIEIIPLEGLSTGGEVSAQAMARLVDQARRSGVRYVFLENMEDARLARQLQHEAGLKPGGVLYSDALSTPGGKAPDYLALLRANTETLASAMADSAR